ncbi:MAG TPA: hypothetical protein VMV20_08220 [Chitinophagaceae bacterium]|nr:hypothetical protein [Chitinophagaceae bacterium]
MTQNPEESGALTPGSIFHPDNAGLDHLALELFKIQYRGNRIYRDFADALGKNPDRVSKLEGIPFLPIGFFKTHRVVTGEFEPALIFESSRTTGSASLHYVRDPNLYRESFRRGFEWSNGRIQDFVILALLPGYLERPNSSLVFMVEDLIRCSGHPESGFYLRDHGKLHQMLVELEKAGRKTLLLGVTYALLDFAAAFSLKLGHTVVMETGGMKGRGREMVREELHEALRRSFGVERIHSEYGMTELLSQAYAQGGGRFACPPWMRAIAVLEDDPFRQAAPGQAGTLNFIDLANRDSCAFLATEDTGIVYPDGSFEVLGRLDGSALRGCSLMTA